MVWAIKTRKYWKNSQKCSKSAVKREMAVVLLQYRGPACQSSA
jgi:hypothetical protein